MQRVSKSWRWPVGGLVVAGVGALFVPIGGLIWVHLLISLGAVVALARMAHREVPFPVALAQLRLGGDHPAVLRARALSAAMALQRGRPDIALYRLNSVLPDMTRVLGPAYPDTLSTRLLSLQIRGETGNLPDRLTAIRELIGEITPVLGAGHPDTLAARQCLAEWLGQDGRTEEAEAAYEDVVAAGTEHLGADHNLVLIARSSLTILRYDRTGPDKGAAVDDMTAIVAAMERTLGAAHPTAAGTRRLLTQWQNAQAGSGA
ncbi:tetratricopeptide repeat protein [Streptomyces sp. NPDC008159]|uniref:tetratricopeptide repeat protein n=1 Tax=Streptomyces sp. NPDC008159 TaxID=3364817 RepID=UPI0036E4C059